MRHFINRLTDSGAGILELSKPQWIDVVLANVHIIQQKMPATPENSDGGLYVGNAGVAYMFYHLSSIELLSAYRSDFLAKAQDYITEALRHAENRSCRDPIVSFILGKAGVYAVGCGIHKSLGNTSLCDDLASRYCKLASIIQPGDFLGCGSDELFVGRAGYLCGALLMQKTLGKQVVSESRLKAICGQIVQSGRDYARRTRSKCPLMYHYYDTEYLGAAHGLSSILQMLLSFPEIIKADPKMEQDIKSSVDFLLGLEQPDHNYPSAMDEASGLHQRQPGEELVHWCHGAPGVVYMLASAYLVWQEPRYLDACKRCAELTWQRGLLRKGPGICHGISGSGYVFLLLHRLTDDPQYLHRAQQFAVFMQSAEFKTGTRTPDCPFSLYEGLAGMVCFLADLTQPDKAAFPLFDVF